MQRIFHTPEGVRDLYGKECFARRKTEEKIHQVFWSHGFEDIQTPVFEFFEVFSNEVGTIPSRELFKFFDRDNDTLTLRPDFTPSVSRACASYFTPEVSPVNLCYRGNAFINSTHYQGKLKETMQMGVEKMGDSSVMADAEILAMTVECMKAAGLEDFQISVGQVEFFKALLEETKLDELQVEQLRSLISQKNVYGVEDLLAQVGIKGRQAKAFSMLPQLFGPEHVLKTARSLTDNPRALSAVVRLEEIYALLKIYGYEKYIMFDFGMLSKFRYYTGIIFQGYTYGAGNALVKGGRYDDLLEHFGKKAPSIGFVIVLDSLMAALGEKAFEEDEPEVCTVEYTMQDAESAIRKAMELRAQGRRIAMRPAESGQGG